MNKIKKFIEENYQHLTKCVVPIFKNSEFDKSIYGSSLFVYYNENVFLITASHVIGELGHLKLFIFNGENLERLQCDILSLKSINETDSVDLSLLRLSDNSIKTLSKLHKAMSLDSIGNILPNGSGLLYLVIGYPYSKNRFRAIVKGTKVFTYIGIEVDESKYQELKTDQAKEFILKIESENVLDMNPDNIIQNLPYLNGISGGGVWCIGNSDIIKFYPPYPIGIVREITPKKDALKITRIQYIIPAFKKLMELKRNDDENLATKNE